jgi:hypothetical protein
VTPTPGAMNDDYDPHAATLQVLPPKLSDDNDDPCQANERVWPGTRESRSCSHSPSSGGPTRYDKHFSLLLQIGQLLGSCSWEATLCNEDSAVPE